MDQQNKESYSEPVVVSHDLLRDITGVSSGQVSCQKSFDSACPD